METIDYTGQICPYPVVLIIEAVERMEKGNTVCFKVDDPLAIKSIPEELDEFVDIDLAIERTGKCWLVTVARTP